MTGRTALRNRVLNCSTPPHSDNSHQHQKTQRVALHSGGRTLPRWEKQLVPLPLHMATMESHQDEVELLLSGSTRQTPGGRGAAAGPG
jgi:hypothetical protein